MTISVIMPFYDEIIFFKQSLHSVLDIGSSLTEVIIVNDNQNLDSQNFLNEVGKTDSRIKIIQNQENVGCTVTKNKGLEEAIGEYILFLDSDDIISSAGINYALKYAKRTQADITHLPTLVMAPERGSFALYERDRVLFGKNLTNLKVSSFPEIRFAIAGWSFLFRRKFLVDNKIRFSPKQRRCGDHLFILEATQAAKRISTVNKWCHLWRHRGGSISSKKMKPADYRLQISSISQSLKFLSKHYHHDTEHFQRDLAFCFNRYISNWPLLNECIPKRSTCESSLSILNEVQESLNLYRLNGWIENDPILNRIYKNGVYSREGILIKLSELPSIYDMITEKDWDSVQQKLGIRNDTSSLFSRSKQSKILPFGYRRKSNKIDSIDASTYKLVLNTHIPLMKNQDFSNNECAELHVEEPANLLLQLYESRLKNKTLREERMFSEFILDEMESLIVAAKEPLSRINKDCQISITNSRPSNSFVKITCSAFEKIFHQSLIHNQTSKDRVSNSTDITTMVVIEEATRITDSYIKRSIANTPSSSPAPSLSDVAIAWRYAENKIIPDLETILASRLLSIANKARFGDANWFGERTWKSRVRSVFRNLKN